MTYETYYYTLLLYSKSLKSAYQFINLQEDNPQVLCANPDSASGLTHRATLCVFYTLRSINFN